MKKYYFINKFDTNHISKQSKDTGIIYRNYSSNNHLEMILKLKTYCKNNGYKFYLSNNIKLAIKLKLPFFKSSSLFTCREKSPKLIMIIEKYANIVPATVRIGAIFSELRKFLKSKILINALAVIFTSLNKTIKKKSTIPA